MLSKINNEVHVIENGVKMSDINAKSLHYEFQHVKSYFLIYIFIRLSGGKG